MRIGFLKIVAIIGLALVFNACGSRIDESVQDNIQEEQYSQDSNTYNEEGNSSASNEEESSSGESYSQNDEENAEVYQQQEGDPIDILIESKIDSAGILTLTEYEFSDEIALRAIERRITFTLTHLDDRDAMIKKIKELIKKNGETFAVVKEEKPGMMEILATTWAGAEAGGLAGSFFPGIGNLVGMLGGGATGFAFSMRDYIGNIFSKKKNWLISKPTTETLLNVIFVENTKK